MREVYPMALCEVPSFVDEATVVHGFGGERTTTARMMCDWTGIGSAVQPLTSRTKLRDSRPASASPGLQIRAVVNTDSSRRQALAGLSSRRTGTVHRLRGRVGCTQPQFPTWLRGSGGLAALLAAA